MLSTDTKQTTTMQHAIANASPAIRSRIRKITYNAKPGSHNRCLNFIFDDDKLSGRYFSLSLSGDLAVIQEVDKPTTKGLGHCLAKQAGDKGDCMVAFTCARTDGRRTYQNTKFKFDVDNFSQSPPHGIAPDWSGGKLKYKVKFPYVDMISAAEETAAELTTSIPVAAATPPISPQIPSQSISPQHNNNPTPASPAMPRLSTIKSMLNDLRKIERDTPYRLERDNDGVLHFVARIG